MAIVIPHVFQDNVNESASGVQLNENFNVLKAAAEALEVSVAALQAVTAFITDGTHKLRVQAGSFVVPGYGGGRGGFDIALPFAWPTAHLSAMAQCYNDATKLPYGVTSAFPTDLGHIHLDVENGPNFEAAHMPWISIGY